MGHDIDKIGGFFAFDDEPPKGSVKQIRRDARAGNPGPGPNRPRPAVLQAEAMRCRDALAYAQQEVIAELTPLKIRADELEAILALGVLPDDALVIGVAELARVRAAVQMIGNAWNAKSRQIVATFDVRWRRLAAEFAAHYRFPNHLDRIDLDFPVSWSLADAADAFEFQFSAPTRSPMPLAGPVVPDDLCSAVMPTYDAGELPPADVDVKADERQSGDPR